MSEMAADTCNISLNRLKTERAAIGRRALEKGYKSTGQMMWDFFMKGCELSDPELADALKQARLNRFN